jgi:hypothetical protein
MFEHWVLGKILYPKKQHVTAACSEVGNEKIHYLYFSPNIIGVINSRKIRRAMKNEHKILVS